MGEDDRHLDFQVANLLRTGAAGRRELVVVTVVHCRNRLGRTYLAVIAPFHRTILRANLERAWRVDVGGGPIQPLDQCIAHAGYDRQLECADYRCAAC